VYVCVCVCVCVCLCVGVCIKKFDFIWNKAIIFLFKIDNVNEKLNRLQLCALTWKDNDSVNAY